MLETGAETIPQLPNGMGANMITLVLAILLR